MSKNTFSWNRLAWRSGNALGLGGFLLLIIAELSGLFGLASLAAHPHIFIDGQLAPKISADAHLCQGVLVRWAFDQIYSAQLIMDFDKNNDRKIDAAESQDFYQQAFQHLRELHYFLQIAKKDQGSPATLMDPNTYFGAAQDFVASIENGKLIYQFYVPFHDPAHKENLGLELSAAQEYLVYLEDVEYFIAFDSQLAANLGSGAAILSSEEFMVENSEWGAYPVRAVSMKSRS